MLAGRELFGSANEADNETIRRLDDDEEEEEWEIPANKRIKSDNGSAAAKPTDLLTNGEVCARYTRDFALLGRFVFWSCAMPLVLLVGGE